MALFSTKDTPPQQRSSEPQAAHNGTSYLNSTTLRDDTSIDQIDMLDGSSGNDWFIFQGGEDKVVGESSLEDQYDTSTLP